MPPDEKRRRLVTGGIKKCNSTPPTYTDRLVAQVRCIHPRNNLHYRHARTPRRDGWIYHAAQTRKGSAKWEK
jgi:hypothetical protein